jgi:hypothetical protein
MKIYIGHSKLNECEKDLYLKKEIDTAVHLLQ